MPRLPDHGQQEIQGRAGHSAAPAQQPGRPPEEQEVRLPEADQVQEACLHCAERFVCPAGFLAGQVPGGDMAGQAQAQQAAEQGIGVG